MEYPHRVVDNVLDGLEHGASGFVSGAKNVIQGVGKSVMGGLDKPFTGLTGKEGPHRIADRAADGFLDSNVQFINQGVLGGAKTFGKGIMKALDHPLEQLGGEMKKPRFLNRK